MIFIIKTFVIFAVSILAVAINIQSAQATASMLVWPIDPIIEPNRNGGSVWLENRGRKDAVMQVRVLRWQQKNGEDLLEDQSEVVASPPIMRIASGARQMVRLVVTDKAQRRGEGAYRIVIDEVPARLEGDTQAQAHKAAAMINFKMRYSIPLFVYGADSPYASLKDKPDALDIKCRFMHENGTAYITLTNNDHIRAQLIDLSFKKNDATKLIRQGLAGYVLPGAQMKWPVEAADNTQSEVVARVNGSAGQVSFGRCAG